jgi:hypothetical protein
MSEWWAVAFGTLYAILLALSAWMLLFTVSFGWENRDNTVDDWLGPFAVAMFVSAVAVFVGAITRRRRLVVLAYMFGVAVSVPGLRYALEDWSDHADGKLLALGLAIALSGFLAAVLITRAARDPQRHVAGRNP